MLKRSLILAFVSYLLLAGVVLYECEYLAPLSGEIWTAYGEIILMFSGILLLNLTAGIYLLFRRFSLAETGDKLAHLEKQLRGEGTLSEELTKRILERQ